MARKKNYQYIAEDDSEFEYERPSRSQKKRDSTALQKMGEELVSLPLSKVKQLPISEDMLEALTLMARITDREGRRRQMQYIGKLMREDATEELRTALDNLRQGHTEDTARFHHAERLREILLGEDTAEQNRVLGTWEQSVQDEINELVQRARKDSSTASKRVLFRKLLSLQ